MCKIIWNKQSAASSCCHCWNANGFQCSTKIYHHYLLYINNPTITNPTRVCQPLWWLYVCVNNVLFRTTGTSASSSWPHFTNTNSCSSCTSLLWRMLFQIWLISFKMWQSDTLNKFAHSCVCSLALFLHNHTCLHVGGCTVGIPLATFSLVWPLIREIIQRPRFFFFQINHKNKKINTAKEFDTIKEISNKYTQTSLWTC